MCRHMGPYPAGGARAQHGDKMTNGYGEAMMSGEVVRANCVCHRCPLKAPNADRGDKTKDAFLKPTLLEPMDRQNGDITLALPVTTRLREKKKIINGYHTPSITRAH